MGGIEEAHRGRDVFAEILYAKIKKMSLLPNRYSGRMKREAFQI